MLKVVFAVLLAAACFTQTLGAFAHNDRPHDRHDCHTSKKHPCKT